MYRIIVLFFIILTGCSNLENASSFREQLGENTVIFKVDKYFLAPETIPQGDDILIKNEKNEITYKNEPDGSMLVSGEAFYMKSDMINSSGITYSYQVSCYPNSIFPDRIDFDCTIKLNDEEFNEVFHGIKWGRSITVIKCSTKKPILIGVVVIRPFLVK